MALLDGARKLRHGEHRHVEVAREDLERARDLRDLLDAVLDRRPRGHQLHVVDDDQPEVRLLRLQAARLRADLHHRDRARVVHVDRRLHQRVASGRQPRPVVGGELARAQAVRLDLRLAAHEPLRHLRLRHLEGEQRDRPLVPDGEVRARCTSPNADFPMLGRAATMTRLPRLEAGGQADPGHGSRRGRR